MTAVLDMSSAYPECMHDAPDWTTSAAGPLTRNRALGGYRAQMEVCWAPTNDWERALGPWTWRVRVQSPNGGMGVAMSRTQTADAAKADANRFFENLAIGGVWSTP